MLITDQHHTNPPSFYLYFSLIFQSRKVITTGKHLKCTLRSSLLSLPKMCNLFCKENSRFANTLPETSSTLSFLQGLGNFKKENTQASYIIAQLLLKSKSQEFNPYLSTKARKKTNLNQTSTLFKQLSQFQAAKKISEEAVNSLARQKKPQITFFTSVRECDT